MDGLCFVLLVSCFSCERIDFLVCSHSDVTKDGIYTYFIDNQRASHHQSVIFGLRELNSSEIEHFCSNISSNNGLPISTEPFNFSSNYELRTYTSGCYYLDSNNNWQSDGLLVSSDIVSFKNFFSIKSVSKTKFRTSSFESVECILHSGWTSDKSLSNTMLLNASDNVCRWISGSPSTYQLELCVC